MDKIKAKETVYNGFKFRSRLEARWAVIFDTLKIKYQYEPEGFDLGNGQSYLPDFYLPEIGYYAEVKGMSEHIVNDLKKTETFVLSGKTAIMILGDIPYDPCSEGLYWIPVMYYSARSGGHVAKRYGFLASEVDLAGNLISGYFQDDFNVGYSKHWNYTKYHMENNPHVSNEEKCDFAYSAIQPISGAILDDEFNSVKSLFELQSYGDVQGAFLKARQARFEHGETPKP